jgi:hypothetical protein
MFIGFKNVYDSDRREIMYNTLTEFGIPTKLMKLLRLIKMCLNETYSGDQIDKMCLTYFVLRKYGIEEMLYRNCFSTFL